MCLKRIDIQGFKSFGDRVKLELHQGLAVIVGPNGSGKSNISDAISWCLGEQRASSLRGSRMEDVIFAGSDKRKPVGMAEVTLTLENVSKIFSLPYDEVSVTRRLYRSGESEFLINKVPCRLKDIQALFMDTGLGRGAYSLIGQGKVDEILSSRPEERRSVIEEAAGIVKYRHRKEEALRKLSAAQQDLNRISDIINELAGRIEPLAEQAEKTRQFKKIQTDAWDLELSLFKRDWEDLTAKAKEISEQLEKLKNESIDERPLYEKELEQAKEKLLTIENSIRKGQERNLEIQTNLEKLSNRVALNNEQFDYQTNEQKRVNQEVKETSENIDELLQELNFERDKYTKLQLITAQQSKDENDCLLDKLEQEVKEKQEKFQNLNADLIDQFNLVANNRNIKNQAADRKEQLTQRLGHLRKIAQAVEEKETSLKLAIETAKGKVVELHGRKKSLEQQQQRAEEEQEQVNSQLSSVGDKLAIVKEEMVAKHSRLKVLEEQLHSHSGFMKPVRELLKATEHRQGDVLGICGAVADIIQVPRGFETAIEAALGGALQNLVTETSSQAKAAIEYLKKHNLGRATFLPLDSLRPAPPGEWEKKALGLTGVIGLAADLIDIEAKYRSVVQLLMGRLVVVDTLDHAIQVARQMQQRLRIVTLTGELLNPGGSLSGGGQIRNASGMLHTRSERDDLAKKVKELHQQAHQLNGESAHKQQIQQQLMDELKQFQSELVNLGLEMQAAEMDLTRSNEDLKRVDERSIESLYEIENIEQEIKQWLHAEEEASAKLTIMEEELEHLQSEIALTQEELAATRASKTQLEERVHSEKVRQAELRQESIGLQKIIDRLEKEVKEKEHSLAAAKTMLVQLDSRKKQLVEQHTELSAAIQQWEQERIVVVEEMDKEQKQYQTAIQIVRELEKQLQELQEQWMQTGQKIHTLELQQARNQTELDLLLTRLEEFGSADPQEIKVEPVANKRLARADLQKLKTTMNEMGPINAAAEEEYKEVTERYNFLQGQQADLEESRASLQQLINELNRLMSSQFESAFKIINQNFTSVFQQLFGGGGAAMALTEGDPLTCGIEITARPPGKKNQTLSLLSGGERALTAIALLFAILKYKPSPFCVLDEIEASLDEANVKRFADYLSRTSEEVQFIVVSHRKGTMENADALYGVTMDEAGVTRILSMSLDENKGNKRLA